MALLLSAKLTRATFLRIVSKMFCLFKIVRLINRMIIDRDVDITETLQITVTRIANSKTRYLVIIMLRDYSMNCMFR